MRSFEKDGYWFLPDNPDRKVFGRLSVSPEKSPKLFLADQLYESENIRKMISGDSFEIINGYFLDGKEATLVDCYQKGSLKTGFQTADISARCAILGHQFGNKSDIKLSSVFARYTYLEEWLRSSGFEISYQIQNEESAHNIILKQSVKPPIELGKLSEFQVSLLDEPWISREAISLLSFFGEIPNKLDVKERKSILLKSEHERNFEEFINAFILFQDFLIFCTGKTIDIFDVFSFVTVTKKKPRMLDPSEFIRISNENEKTIVRDSESGLVVKKHSGQYQPSEEEVTEPNLIQIYFATDIKVDEQKKLNRNNVLIMFHEIKGKMPDVLNAWEKNSQDFGSIFDLYLRLTYIPERHIDDLFLTISQAVEALHRVCHRQEKFDNDIFDCAREAMIKAIPIHPDEYGLNGDDESIQLITELKELIENKIRYINEFSLKERLMDLYEIHKDCFPDQLFDQNEIKTFSKQVRDTRGSLTHVSNSSKQKQNKHVVPREKRNELTKKLLTLLQACLLKQLSLDDSQVKGILSRR